MYCKLNYETQFIIVQFLCYNFSFFPLFSKFKELSRPENVKDKILGFQGFPGRMASLNSNIGGLFCLQLVILNWNQPMLSVYYFSGLPWDLSSMQYLCYQFKALFVHMDSCSHTTLMVNRLWDQKDRLFIIFYFN